MDRTDDKPRSQRFTVQSPLGEGGMGAVYEALDRERNARVALKMLRQLGPEEVLRFKGEFRKLQDLHHPNLVSLGELVEEQGQWFLTMELVRGSDFLTYVCDWRGPEGDEPSTQPPDTEGETRTMVVEDPTRQGGEAWLEATLPSPTPGQAPRFDEGRLRGALAQLARGLHALHRAGKVHRDIKPSNLLVTAEGRLVLLDFGILSDLGEPEGGRQGHVLGTVAYMAPEQVQGAPPSPAADWYSVGVLLYQSLTGQRPFVGTARQVMRARCQLEPRPPQALLPGLPEDLCRLALELLAREPERRPSGEQVLGRLGVTPQLQEEAWSALALPFVGRREQLRALHRALEDCRQGPSVVVRVEGESGVGKSRLVRRFLDEVLHAWPRAVVLSGRCYERESVPFKGVDALVDALARHLSGPGREHAARVLGPDAAPLVRLFPVLGQVERPAEGAHEGAALADPLQLRVAAFAALRRVLGRLAEQHPLILALDDLQWAGQDSAALLDEVLRAQGLLLVGTARVGSTTPTQGLDAELHPHHHWAQARVVALEGLRPEEARTLVERLLHEGGGAEDAQVRRIVQESAGHPLFVDALVRHRRQESGSARPLRLEEALWARAGLLEPGARALLELLTVASGPLTHSVAAHAAALEAVEYAKATASLRGAHLAITTGPAALDRVEVLHDRVRQAVAPHLEDGARRAWHTRLASALEALAQGDAEVRAWHWGEGGQVERAAGYYVQAAQESFAALAFSRAARLYEVALRLRPLTPEQARPLRVARAEALVHAGQGQHAAQAFLDAAEGAAPAEALSLRRRAGEQLLVSGHVEQALALLRQVLAEVGGRYPETEGQALASALWQRARLGLHPGRPRQAPSEVPAEARERLEAYGCLAQGLSGVDPLRAYAFQSGYLLLALEAAQPRHLCRALVVEANNQALRGPGRRPRIEATARRAEALAEQPEVDEATRGFVLGARAIRHNLLCEYHLARATFERALALLERCQQAWWERGITWEAGSVSLLAQGDVAWLKPRLPLVMAEARERGDLRTASLLDLGAGFLVRLGEDDPEGARALLDDVMGRLASPGFRVQGFSFMVRRATLHRYEGQPDEALRLLEQWAPRLKKARLLSFPMLRGLVLEQRARARVLRASRGGAEAGELLREVEADARQLAGLQLEYFRGVAESLRAALAERQGRPEAVERYGRAANTLESQGALLAAWAQRLRQGELLGGEAGQALVAQARGWMEQHGLRNPEKLTALHTSGPLSVPSRAL